MSIKEQVEKWKNKALKRYSPKQLKELINRKVNLISKRTGFKGYQLKAVSHVFAGVIKKLGLYPVSKERIYMALTGKAEELEEVELISVGMMIKYFKKKDLDVTHFVWECKEGVYRE